LGAIPGHKLDDAWLARDTKAHWLVALASAGFFFALMLLLFPSPGTKPASLLAAGAFTGTIGIILLLGFQWAAASMQGAGMVGGGKIAIIFFIIKMIGLSYHMATSSEYGFLTSFLGFTFGVGLCEEVTKFIPVLIRVRPAPGKSDPTWQSLLLWGLASGVGFGVAEGIMYSGELYNALYGWDIYAVRFISCVVLHAMWTASAAITLYNRQHWLTDSDGGWAYCGRVLMLVGISMTLHGLYDVLLKKEHEGLALIVALATFAWLAFQIETMRRKEPIAALA
jgi:RsiW-degrading membrane proteinase PrsW (M82 family)